LVVVVLVAMVDIIIIVIVIVIVIDALAIRTTVFFIRGEKEHTSKGSRIHIPRLSDRAGSYRALRKK